MNNPTQLAARDLQSLLHPMSRVSALREQDMMIVVRGNGIYLWDDADNRYIDGISGLWCASLGYGNEEIIEAASDQMRTLSYGHLFAERGNDVAIELAETLKEMVPGSYSKVFYGTSGSDANDTQIKLVRYYNNAVGRPRRKKIISRYGGYHGVSLGAGSATGMTPFHTGFDLPAADVIHTDCPHHYRGAHPGETEEAYADRLADTLEKLIVREDPETVAAFIAEPIMGAGGVIVPPKTYFPKVQRVLRKYDVVFIADEVITAFGRTGQPFGMQTCDLEPDTVSLAKSLTSAYQSLSAVMIPQFMIEAITDVSPRWGVFGHGFTYSGHPVAAAVALKVLEIYERDRVFDHARVLGEQFQRSMAELREHPLVGEVRGSGLMGACELVANKRSGLAFPAEAAVAQYCVRIMLNHGLIGRALGNAVVLSPPLITTPEELDEIMSIYSAALDATLDWATNERLLEA
jgi:4-aminobutyrate--pyruvate transaminase